MSDPSWTDMTTAIGTGVSAHRVLFVARAMADLLRSRHPVEQRRVLSELNHGLGDCQMGVPVGSTAPARWS